MTDSNHMQLSSKERYFLGGDFAISNEPVDALEIKNHIAHKIHYWESALQAAGSISDARQGDATRGIHFLLGGLYVLESKYDSNQ